MEKLVSRHLHELAELKQAWQAPDSFGAYRPSPQANNSDLGSLLFHSETKRLEARPRTEAESPTEKRRPTGN